ncbi:hypothetical protein [Nonomuraea sp. NPDC048916]|uniref:hypothetical protein n=1 Tax=Nonomuraea sp. NPDC048916 TaxID=3154232 RepID=UPI003411AE41
MASKIALCCRHRVAHGVAAAVAVRQRQDEQPDACVLGGGGDALEEPDGVGIGEGVGQGLAEQQAQQTAMGHRDTVHAALPGAPVRPAHERARVRVRLAHTLRWTADRLDPLAAGS